ncbi:RHS repeat-associated core domain-containing protein [Facilibium subflavum]|uniref:RHS repeat-associated core domain-containing protein n=1 Tax=Facilibium subflavum TaxID=2219058 RepID=UPI000E655F44|nr:RHS repeat-associated core domain-containing protein [Facilibium subflavum]
MGKHINRILSLCFLCIIFTINFTYAQSNNQSVKLVKTFYYVDNGKSIKAFLPGQTAEKYSSIQPQSFDYSAYGFAKYQRDPSPDTSFLYNGEYDDPKVSTLYLRARWYALNGNFLTRDSKLDIWNKYAFTAGDPINYTDPTGHESAGWWNFTHSSFARFWQSVYSTPTGAAFFSLGAAQAGYGMTKMLINRSFMAGATSFVLGGIFMAQTMLPVLAPQLMMQNSSIINLGILGVFVLPSVAATAKSYYDPPEWEFVNNNIDWDSYNMANGVRIRIKGAFRRNVIRRLLGRDREMTASENNGMLVEPRGYQLDQQAINDDVRARAAAQRGQRAPEGPVDEVNAVEGIGEGQAEFESVAAVAAEFL